MDGYSYMMEYYAAIRNEASEGDVATWNSIVTAMI
jgi:hypothetical protein